MSNSRLIICEKTSHWAAALRRQVARHDLSLVETRSWAGCEAALAESAASLVAVEVTAVNLEAALAFITRLESRFFLARFVALLDADIAGTEMLFREAGAIDAIASILDVPRLARLAIRHVAVSRRSQGTMREFVSERMPWPAQASDRYPV